MSKRLSADAVQFLVRVFIRLWTRSLLSSRRFVSNRPFSSLRRRLGLASPRVGSKRRLERRPKGDTVSGQLCSRRCATCRPRARPRRRRGLGWGSAARFARRARGRDGPAAAQRPCRARCNPRGMCMHAVRRYAERHAHTRQVVNLDECIQWTDYA